MSSYIASLRCDGSMTITATLPEARTTLVSVRVTGSSISLVWLNSKADKAHQDRLVQAIRARHA